MRVTFLSQPLLRPHGNGDEWVLHEDFVALIETDAADDSTVITVPQGFITDLASVPRLPVMFMAFEGKARRSAVLHDFLYERQYPRAWADAVFYAAMKNEVNNLDQYLMWLAVRLGGQSAWADVIPLPPEIERQAP